MEILLTACIPLFLIAALLRGLQHGFYALHMLVTGGICWLAQNHFGVDAEMFSHAAISVALAAHLISINIITFFAYAHDKRASRRGEWRIPEKTLHGFALVGGTFGAWVGQKILRHKNKKRSFQVIFWLIFVVQVGIAAWLLIKS